MVTINVLTHSSFTPTLCFSGIPQLICKQVDFCLKPQVFVWMFSTWRILLAIIRIFLSFPHFITGQNKHVYSDPLCNNFGIMYGNDIKFINFIWRALSIDYGKVDIKTTEIRTPFQILGNHFERQNMIFLHVDIKYLV